MRNTIIFLCFVFASIAQTQYFIGEQGQSCNEVCFAQGMNCNTRIITNNSYDLFTQLGISCSPDYAPWWAEDQPSFVSDPSDPNYGKCVGFVDVPGVICSGSYPTTERLCRCGAPTSARLFGTGLSGGEITTQEKWIFQYFLKQGDYGVMTHFWTTYMSSVDNGVVIRYYVDGEQTPSIEFTPSLACGVGYFDTQGPWGNQWFGKGAADGAWFVFISIDKKIPFYKSIVVTAQHMWGNYGGFYMIVRGATNIPISVGGTPLPIGSKLNLFKISGLFQPLEWVPIVSLPAGTEGVHWMHALQVESGNLNFLEGCYHAYVDGNNEFPGILLSTGTEDYFDSAWYFNGGEFHLPVSGFTHYNSGSNNLTWSAYRFHDMDPIWFSNGFQLVWRVGDMLDAAGIKCNIETGGTIVGSPTVSNVTSYAWVYTW